MHYTQAITESAERRLMLERELSRAAKVDWAGFSLNYQPVVTSSVEMIAAEVLLRWTLPDGSVVSPAEFIPLAEKTGYINSLSRWTLQTACKQLAVWRDSGVRLSYLAINISALQLDPHPPTLPLRDLLLDALSIYKLKPSDLMLEVTESTLTDESSDCFTQLAELVQLGFLLAIDDFGTGYSSMQQLHRVPATTIKIDKSFVDTVDSNVSQQAIVESMIFLSKRLDCKTVAEGVESVLQFESLKAMGCDHFQGYFFSRPLDVDQFSKALASPESLAAKHDSIDN